MTHSSGEHKIFDSDSNELNQQLCEACKVGNVELVRSLIASGAQVSYIATTKVKNGNAIDHSPPMHIALTRSRKTEELINLFLESGADPNAKYESNRWSDSFTCSSFYMAIVSRTDLAILKKFIAHGANVNTLAWKESPTTRSSMNPLHAAVQDGDIELTELLLHSGAKVDALRVEEIKLNGYTEGVVETALHIACLLPLSKLPRALTLISLLVSYGASINSKRKILDKALDYSLSTPLHIAIRRANPALVNLLLSLGADRKISWERRGCKFSTFLIETSPVVEASLHYCWRPEFHKFYPKIVKEAVLSILIISKRQTWQFDKILLLHLISFVASAYLS